eukprot:9289372-Alexandrium_andersonii.AAC.1
MAHCESFMTSTSPTSWNPATQRRARGMAASSALLLAGLSARHSPFEEGQTVAAAHPSLTRPPAL